MIDKKTKVFVAFQTIDKQIDLNELDFRPRKERQLVTSTPQPIQSFISTDIKEIPEIIGNSMPIEPDVAGTDEKKMEYVFLQYREVLNRKMKGFRYNSSIYEIT